MYLRCAVHDSPKSWKSWLSLAEIWYNSSLHSALGCSPFKATYGYDATLGAAPIITPDTPLSVAEIIANRELHLESLKENLARAHNRMKLFADKKRQDYSFSVGDQVLLKLQPYTQSTVASRPYPKLSYKFYGLYTILEKVGTTAYRLQLPAEIHHVFHISQLKPFPPDHTPVCRLP
jgi:hypothetical protein